MGTDAHVWHSRLFFWYTSDEVLLITNSAIIIERRETNLIKDGPELSRCRHVEYFLRFRFHCLATIDLHRSSLNLAFEGEVESWNVLQVMIGRILRLHLQNCIGLILFLKVLEGAAESNAYGGVILWCLLWRFLHCALIWILCFLGYEGEIWLNAGNSWNWFGNFMLEKLLLRRVLLHIFDNGDVCALVILFTDVFLCFLYYNFPP